MAYITPAEITTHLGAEQIEAISDGDETMLQAAINGAMVEAKGYLSAFDMATELAKNGAARNALLIIFIKDIAVWHFINICNVNTDIDLREKRYDRAVSWLISVQKGNVVPDITAKVDESGVADNLPYKVTSNPKRTNHV